MERENLLYKVGQNVVYKRHCVYTISDIKEEKICGEKKTYYVLMSVYDDRAAVYVPTDSEVLVSQIKKPLTEDQVHSIIEESKTVPVEWIENRAERFKFFDELMSKCELSEVIKAYVLTSEKRNETIKNKTKFFAHDERTLQSAQKLLCEAFAFSLGISKDRVIPYVLERLN